MSKDFSYAFRTLRKSPIFTITVVGTIARLVEAYEIAQLTSTWTDNDTGERLQSRPNRAGWDFINHCANTDDLENS